MKMGGGTPSSKYSNSNRGNNTEDNDYTGSNGPISR